MTTNINDVAISRLTDAIRGALPHLDALHARIVEHDDQEALELLVLLSSAATELADEALGRTS
jgi:hypothetical protein